MGSLQKSLAEMRSYSIQVGPIYNMTDVLIKRRNLETETHTHKEDSVRMKAGMGAMLLEAKDARDCQETPQKLGETHRTDSHSPLRRNLPSQHLDLRFLVSEAERQ